MHIKNGFPLILLVAFAATLALGGAGADEKISGILMDKACAVDMKMDAKGHDKDCAQMPDCVKSGYGVVTSDGKFLPFDAKGNQQATAWLKATKLKTNLKITVTGTVDKGVLKVTTLQ